jgi:hypothetical protein
MLSLKSIPVLLAAAVLLAACSTPPPGNAFPEQSWAHKPKIKLLVGEIVVEQSYRDRVEPPNAERQAPRTPSQEMRNWAQRRLLAAGSGGRATLTISEGSILQTDLPAGKGTFSFFSSSAARRFQGTLIASLTITNGSGVTVGRVEAQARQTTELPQGMSLNEREEALFDMVQALLVNMDREMESQINRHLSDYLVP